MRSVTRTLTVGFLGAALAACGSSEPSLSAVESADPTDAAAASIARDAVTPTATIAVPATLPTNTDEPGTTTASAPGGAEPLDPNTLWARSIPEPEISSRWDDAIVGLDSGLVIWGGRVPSDDGPDASPLVDGMFFERATAVWRTVAAAPLAGGPASGIAIDGTRAMFADHSGAAIYDTVTDSWRALDAPPGALADLIGLTLAGRRAMLLPSGATWDLATETWGAVPPLPGELRQPVIASTGSHVMVAGGDPADAMRPGLGYVLDLASGTWNATQPTGLPDVWGATAGAAIGDEVLFVLTTRLGPTAAIYSPARRSWRVVTDLPVTRGCPESRTTAASWAGGVVIGQDCGFIALTADGRSLPFDSPSWRKRAIAATTLGGLMVGGGVTALDFTGLADSADLPAWTTGGATIDRRLRPGAPTRPTPSSGASQTSVRLDGPDCQLAILAPDPDVPPAANVAAQRLLADIAVDAAAGPPSVTFSNLLGRYELRCPSPAAYADAVAGLRLSGEALDPVDATAELAGVGISPTADGLLETVSAALAQQHGAPDRNPVGYSTATDVAAPTSTMSLFLTLPEGDAAFDLLYVVEAADTGQGWRITEATRRTICPAGVTRTGDALACA